MTEPEKTEVPQVSESDTSEALVTPEDVSAEDASDAQLRQWAKDNNIEGVPATGRLSAAWRDQISAAMASALNDMATALDPKEEASVEVTSSDPSDQSEMEMTTSTNGEETSSQTNDSSDEESQDEEEVVEEEVAPVAPEFETGTYRSVFKAPDTFVSSQAYTA